MDAECVRLLCRRPEFMSFHRPAVTFCLVIKPNLNLSLTFTQMVLLPNPNYSLFAITTVFTEQ